MAMIDFSNYTKVWCFCHGLFVSYHSQRMLVVLQFLVYCQHHWCFGRFCLDCSRLSRMGTLRTNSSPNLVNPQILGRILGQIRPQLLQQLHGHFHSQICGHLCPQIWGVTKFSHIFWENFSNQ